MSVVRLNRIIHHLQTEADRMKKDLSQYTAAIAVLQGRGGNTRKTRTAGTRYRSAGVRYRRAHNVSTKMRKAAEAITATTVRKPRKQMSASARGRIAAAQRLRWAKWKKLNRAPKT